MKDKLSLLERSEHDIFHDLEFNHFLGEGIEHEDKVVIIGGVIFGLEEMPVGPEEEFGFLLVVFIFWFFGEFINKHFGESFCVDIDVND